MKGLARIAAVPTAHSLEGPARLEELAGEPFVAFRRSQEPNLFDQFISTCEQVGFSLRIVQGAAGPFTMMSLVAAGIGVAVVPGAVATSFSRKGVRFVRLSGDVLNLALHMSWKEEDFGPASAALARITERMAESEQNE